MAGNYSDKWRYRAGNYRIMAETDDESITFFVVNIGYKKIFNKSKNKMSRYARFIFYWCSREEICQLNLMV